MNELKLIGKTLVNLRGETTREKVAKDLGISLSALCAYEDGKRLPRDEVKIKISEYYGIPGEEIFCRKIAHIVKK